MNAIANIEFFSVAEIEAAPMADLLAYYNANAEKETKRFSDIKSAIKRVTKLWEEKTIDADAAIPPVTPQNFIAAQQEAKKAPAQKAPEANADHVAGEDAGEDAPSHSAMSSMAAALNGTAIIPASAAPTTKKGRAASTGNAEGVAASWSDAEVRAARLIRNKVFSIVNGKQSEHRSLPAAFTDLRIPSAKMIKTRLVLKAKKSVNFEHNGTVYQFILIENAGE